MDSGKLRVYLIKCTNEIESFFKVGVTANTLRRRFGTYTGGNKTMPYLYEVIVDRVISVNRAFTVEDKVLDEFISYSPLIKFGGYMECIYGAENLESRTREIIKNG